MEYQKPGLLQSKNTSVAAEELLGLHGEDLMGYLEDELSAEHLEAIAKTPDPVTRSLGRLASRQTQHDSNQHQFLR